MFLDKVDAATVEHTVKTWFLGHIVEMVFGKMLEGVLLLWFLVLRNFHYLLIEGVINVQDSI